MEGGVSDRIQQMKLVHQLASEFAFKASPVPDGWLAALKTLDAMIKEAEAGEKLVHAHQLSRLEAMQKLVDAAKGVIAHDLKGQNGAIAIVEGMIEEARDADADPKAKAKLATDALDGLHIETMMALSTAHVSESTMGHLVADDLTDVNVKPFGEEGVVLYLPPDEETWNEIRESYVAQKTPEDLWLAMCWARDHSCTWLFLDADAQEADGLKTFDW
jgi:hypothetical protein